MRLISGISLSAQLIIQLRVMNVGIFNGKLNYHLRLRAASDFFLRFTLGFS